MGIDLEALANELRAAGVACEFVPKCGDSHPFWLYLGMVSSVDKEGDWALESTDLSLGDIAIIARHLGAGQPVAADRAALVERIGVTAIAHYSYVDERDVDLRAGTGNDGETWGDLARSIGAAAIAVVEAAGWGPRAEPVAGTGETLSAEEEEHIGRKSWSELRPGVRWEQMSDVTKRLHLRSVRAVLAALPARYAVPMERA